MINKRPVFSIITPTFQRSALLRRAVKSVRAQTFTDYEHIIIDDSNLPETVRIIGEFQDERIILHTHSEQKGAAGGYNSGLKLARGKYILFLDDDVTGEFADPRDPLTNQKKDADGHDKDTQDNEHFP